MSRLDPIDNGIRRYRPGWLVMLGIPVIIASAWVIVSKVRRKQAGAGEPAVTVKEQVREIRDIPKPVPPPSHPLAGRRRLFLADGCPFRYQELTFTRYFSIQHDHPGLVIRDEDPTIWKFVAVEGKEHVYRIYCADPNFPEFHDDNLTYTRLVDDGEFLNDEPPYLTLRDDDPCEWKVHQLENLDQYEVFCMSGEAPFLGQSLGWMTDQEDLQQGYVTPTLGQNGRPAWWILPEHKTPDLPRRVSHLLIMNKGEVKHLSDAREDFAEDGHGIFQVSFETREDEFLRRARDLDYVELVKSLRGNDPVITHPDFPPIIGIEPDDLLNGEIGLKRPDPLFPLIIPLQVKLYAHEIHELTFENTGFWINDWEELENFQSHLDESDAADGRIYHGELFTYIFVSWDR